MDRKKATEKLIRMAQTIASGALPAQVKAFYVFGSYARGALNPNDLDVVVVYETPEESYWVSLIAELHKSGKGPLYAGQVFEARMRDALRRRGERMDILLTCSIGNVTGSSKVKKNDLVLLWTPDDQDIQAKLATIKPRATAGRAERDHLVNLRRLYDRVGAMEKAVQWVHEGVLVLTRVPIDGIAPQLNAFHTHRLELCRMYKVVGQKSMQLLPYAMWWLQQHRQRSQCPDKTEIWSESQTHRVNLGKPSLGEMMERFERQPRIKRQCLIPHIRAREPNELLVFERGPNWQKRSLEKS